MIMVATVVGIKIAKLTEQQVTLLAPSGAFFIATTQYIDQKRYTKLNLYRIISIYGFENQ